MNRVLNKAFYKASGNKGISKSEIVLFLLTLAFALGVTAQYYQTLEDEHGIQKRNYGDASLERVVADMSWELNTVLLTGSPDEPFSMDIKQDGLEPGAIGLLKIVIPRVEREYNIRISDYFGYDNSTAPGSDKTLTRGEFLAYWNDVKAASLQSVRQAIPVRVYPHRIV